MDLSKFERLANLGFGAAGLPNIANHFMVERDGFAALISLVAGDLAEAGSAGIVTEGGLAVLVWRGEQPWFVMRGFERQATPTEVQALRQFSDDLKTALRS